MKTLFTFWLAFTTGIFSIAPAAQALDWQDPQVFRINKEPARSFFTAMTMLMRPFQKHLGIKPTIYCSMDSGSLIG
jgi:beta-galactosidase